MPDPETLIEEETGKVELIVSAPEDARPWEEFEGPENDIEAAMFLEPIEGDAVLSAKARKGLSSRSFADPEGRAYPVHDRAHAKNAIVRFIQFGSRKYKGDKRKSVARRILGAARRYGIKVSDETRRRMMGDSAPQLVDAIANLSIRGVIRARQILKARYPMSFLEGDSEWIMLNNELERRRTKV